MPVEGYYSRVLYCHGDERLTIGAVLLVPRQAGVAEATVAVRMVQDVGRVAAAFGVTLKEVEDVQRRAAAAVERDVSNGVDLCAARSHWDDTFRIGPARWYPAIGEPEETLRHILVYPLC